MTVEKSQEILLDLSSLPSGTMLRSVTADAREHAGRSSLRVTLDEHIAAHGKPGVDFVDMPTFAVLPLELTSGRISVDLFSQLLPTAPDYARAFAGLAYHIADDCEQFEAIYLRPLNGRSLNPPSPRDQRAVQYFAYPDWKFERLRETYPDGRYEAGADIAPGRWSNLAIDVGADMVVAWVDGQEVLRVAPKVALAAGRIGLFVDIGTEAFFADLRVSRA